MLQRARHAFGLLLAPLYRALHYATCGSRRRGLAGLALLAALNVGGLTLLRATEHIVMPEDVPSVA